jgi:membrane protein
MLRPRRGAASLALRVARRVGRGIRRLPRLMGLAAWQGFVGFYNSNDLTYASSIAFFALLSLFPFLLLSLSVLGTFTASDHDRAVVLDFVLRYFPRQFDFVTTQIDAFRQRTTVLGIGGSVVMIWAALGFFGSITTAVNYAWRVERQFGYWKHKLVSFLMLVAAAVLMVVGLLLLSARTVVQATWFASVLERSPRLGYFESVLVEWATTLIFISVVGLLFYFVPNARVRFKDVWPGAVVTGMLWRLALMGFGWYVRDLSRFSVHGSVAAVVVFLMWVYLSSVILLYGVEFTVAYARLRRLIPEDLPPLNPEERGREDLQAEGAGSSTVA